MSRGRCYPDVGARPDPRKNAGRIVGVREIGVKEKSDRHTARKKRKKEREVWISRKYALESCATGHTRFFFS